MGVHGQDWVYKQGDGALWHRLHESTIIFSHFFLPIYCLSAYITAYRVGWVSNLAVSHQVPEVGLPPLGPATYPRLLSVCALCLLSGTQITCRVYSDGSKSVCQQVHYTDYPRWLEKAIPTENYLVRIIQYLDAFIVRRPQSTIKHLMPRLV